MKNQTLEERIREQEGKGFSKKDLRVLDSFLKILPEDILLPRPYAHGGMVHLVWEKGSLLIFSIKAPYLFVTKCAGTPDAEYSDFIFFLKGIPDDILKLIPREESSHEKADI
jgi:hypothetical protein